jgi:hypothetical protein
MTHSPVRYGEEVETCLFIIAVNKYLWGEGGGDCRGIGRGPSCQILPPKIDRPLEYQAYRLGFLSEVSSMLRIYAEFQIVQFRGIP